MVLLVGLGAVVLIWKAPAFLDWIMRQTEAQILASLPADVTAEERERLRDGMSRSRSMIENRQVDPLAVRELQGELVSASRKLPDRLTREDVLALIEALEAFVAASSRQASGVSFLSHGPVQAHLTVSA